MSTPDPMAQIQQRQRDLATELVNKILNDPNFRNQFQNDPEGALKAAGVLDQIAALNQQAGSLQGAGMASPSSQCCITVIY